MPRASTLRPTLLRAKARRKYDLNQSGLSLRHVVASSRHSALLCVCVRERAKCVCVCEREREERERKGEREHVVASSRHSALLCV